MGAKKKMAQSCRREAKRLYKDAGEQLFKKIEELNDCLKKKPRYIPKWWWRFRAKRYIDIDKMEKIVREVGRK